MFRPIGASELVPAYCRSGCARIGTLAGRKIPAIAYNESRAAQLFSHRVNTLTFSTRKMPPVRWQQTTSKTEGSKSNHQNWDKIKVGAVGSGIGMFTAGLTLRYLYDNPPSERWPDFLKNLNAVVMTDKRLKEKDIVIQEKAAEIEKLIADYQKQLKLIRKTYEEQVSQIRDDHIRVIIALKQTGEKELQEARQANLKLRLYQNCSNNEDLRRLHRYLSNHGVIDYNKQMLDPRFMDLLTQALQSNLNPSATGLNFRDSYNISDGLHSLASGLKSNTTIRFLDLGNAHLQADDITAVIRIIKENRSLEELNLYYAPFTDKDAHEIMLALQKNVTNINKLDLSSTNVSDGKKEEMRKTLNITVL